MDAVSRDHLARHAPELLPLCAGVDDTCALVRVETRWDRFVDGTTRLLHIVDFAREPDAASVIVMRDAVGQSLDAAGLRYEGLEQEEQRLRYANGEAVARVWPAWTLLLDAACEVLRVDREAPAPAQPPHLPLGEHVDRVARTLGLEGDVLDVSSEVLMDPDDLERPQGRRARITRRGVLASATLQGRGYAPPDEPQAPWTASLQTDAGPAVVQVWVRDDRATVELTCTAG